MVLSGRRCLVVVVRSVSVAGLAPITPWRVPSGPTRAPHIMPPLDRKLFVVQYLRLQELIGPPDVAGKRQNLLVAIQQQWGPEARLRASEDRLIRGISHRRGRVWVGRFPWERTSRGRQGRPLPPASRAAKRRLAGPGSRRALKVLPRASPVWACFGSSLGLCWAYVGSILGAGLVSGLVWLYLGFHAALTGPI